MGARRTSATRTATVRRRSTDAGRLRARARQRRQHLTNWHTRTARAARSAWSWNIDNTLNWQSGTHSLSFGRSVFFGNVWVDNQQMVPGIGFGVDSTRSGVQPVHRRELPGRVERRSSTNARSALRAARRAREQHRRQPRARRERRTSTCISASAARPARMNEYSLFVQDSWRMTPTLTINARRALGRPDAVPAGQRHHVEGDLRRCVRRVRASAPTAQCRFFQPGASGGKSTRSSSSTTRAIRAGTPTGTTSRRTSASRGGRTCRPAGCARSSAIRNRRRFAPATRSNYDA